MMRALKSLLLLTTFIIHIVGQTVQVKSINKSWLNNCADELIGGMVKQMMSSDNEYIPVPEWHQDITQLVGKIPVKFEIFAWEGFLGELTTLARLGDLTVSKRNGLTIINLPTTLNKVGLHFDDCVITCGTIKSLDEIEILVPSNEKVTLNIQLAIKTESAKCDVVIDYIKIAEVNRLELYSNNLCIVSESEQFQSWALDYFNNVISDVIMFKLTNVLLKQLNTYNICHIINDI